MPNATHLKAPRSISAATDTSTKTGGWFNDLRKLVADCAPNKNDQAIVTITVCIANRINTSKGLLEAAAKLGLNTRHVAMMLKLDTGTDPERHRWWRDERGRYHPFD